MLTSKLILATSLSLAVSCASAAGSYESIFGTTEASSTLTREQVVQEMRDAVARGDRDFGERGYVSAESPAAPRSRAEVQAELHEAMRLGLVGGGEGGAPVATAEQESVITKAGRDAAGHLSTAAVEK